MNLRIIIAAHKKVWLPDDDVYLPLRVGQAGQADLGYTGDDTGDSISFKNANYCELTGLYWTWKNLRYEYIGFCHYRRYFARSRWVCTGGDKKRAIFSREDYEALLAQYDVILPIKRRYYIETVQSQYEHAHYKRDLEAARDAVAALYPSYSAAFAEIMGRRRLHLFNMFVMRWEAFDAYCRWLFDILFDLEGRVDITDYDMYQARIFGFLGERLLDVWMERQRLRTAEVPVVCIQNTNWPKKAAAFLWRYAKGHP